MPAAVTAQARLCGSYGWLHKIHKALDVEPLIGHGDSGILAEDVTALLVSAGEAARSQERGLLLAMELTRVNGRQFLRS
jgi:hypothetical protein